MAITQIRREPFSRMSLMRVTVPKSERSTCHWCDTGQGKFKYGWQGDQLHDRLITSAEGFCSISCWETYIS